LGNNKGFVVRTMEVSLHSLHHFSCRQQTRGFDHGSFPMDPMRLQGVEPRTFDRQETRRQMPRRSRLTYRLCSRIQCRTAWLRCHEALSHTNNNAVLPSALSLVQTQVKNSPSGSVRFAGSLTAYPYRLVSSLAKRIGSLAVHRPVSVS
jgi:hypothetical protein